LSQNNPSGWSHEFRGFLLENPALFHQDKTNLLPVELATQYLVFAKLYPPSSLKIVRAHLFKILHQDLRIFQDLRVQLAEQVNTIEQMEQIVQEIKSRLAISSHRDLLGKKKIQYSMETSWYRRHRQGQKKSCKPSEDEYEKAMETGYGRLFGE
jgi:tRNA-dihydrouridine synthase 1